MYLICYMIVIGIDKEVNYILRLKFKVLDIFINFLEIWVKIIKVKSLNVCFFL